MFLNLLEKWSDLAREEEEIFVVFKHLLSRRINSSLEYVIQVSDIADCQSKYLDFRELLVRRQRRQQLPQFRKCQVERLHPDSFPCSVCGSILLGGPPSPASLLPRQGTRTRSAYAVNGNPVAAVRHGKRSVLVHEIAIEALHVPLRSANIPFKRVQSDLS